MSSLVNTSTLVFCMYFLLLLPLLLLSPTSCLDQGLYLEGKTRLGSTPPSCHSKCNGCHPCMAVQVPTPVGSRKAMRTNSMEFSESTSTNQYSNYKPLGWKCHCDHRFYNP